MKLWKLNNAYTSESTLCPFYLPQPSGFYLNQYLCTAVMAHSTTCIWHTETATCSKATQDLLEKHFFSQNATANKPPYKWSITTNCLHYQSQWNGKVTNTTENKLKGNFCSGFIGDFSHRIKYPGLEGTQKALLWSYILGKEEQFLCISLRSLLLYEFFWQLIASPLDINGFGLLNNFFPLAFFLLLLFLSFWLDKYL